ncbi:hypothetical protein D3C76_1465370 [compost metagenome]
MVIFPNIVIETIMEIKVLKCLKLSFSGTKEFLALGNMSIHRTAYIEQHKHFYSISTLRYHLNIKNTLLGCFTDCTVNIQLFSCTLTRKFTQTAQSNLHLTSTKNLVVI